jgi:hypothetical protein
MNTAKINSRWNDAMLDRVRHLGDPVADAPVAAVLDRGGVDAVNAIMRTLVRVDQPVPAELPTELEAYLTDSLALPEWADLAKIERGQRVFETWGVHICVCLFYASLPASYAAAKGVQVLRLTARLDTDARRRVMETGQFLLDVLAVGGLGDDGKGRRTIQHVRLMHAAVRHLITTRGAREPGLWDPAWGRPLNQEDLAGTLLAFSMVVTQPLERLGVHLSDEDVDAYLHLWNVIGHQLGICDELLVRDLDDATALLEAITRRQFAASTAGREMTEALLELLDELTPGRRFDDMNPAMIRYLIGDEIAGFLMVPESDLVDELGAVTRFADGFVDRVLGGSDRYSPWRLAARTLGLELLQTMVTKNRGGERAPFDIPDHLADNWGLQAPVGVC